MASTVARLGRITNLVHGFIYFSPEATERFAALGLSGRQQYFAGRAAAMGAVGADVVAATFYNFNPAVVAMAIPSAWEAADPASVQAARFAAADDVLSSACPDLEIAVVDRAIEIAQAMVAGVPDDDRPIAAGNRSVAMPDDPLLRLWQLVTIVREWRGDAHVAALRNADVSGLEALLLHGATGEVPGKVLQATRAWTDGDWAAGITGLHGRGLLNADGSFTDDGRSYREAIEAETNRTSQPLVDAVGDAAASELCELLRPIRSGLLASGVFTKPLGGTS